MTLGKYYKANSLVHKLDPRVKIISTFILLFCIFLSQHIYQYLQITLFILIVVKIAKIPYLQFVKSLKPMIILFIFTIIFQTLTHSEDVIYGFWIFVISKYGFFVGLKKGWVLLLIVGGSAILSYTTTSLETTYGLNRLLSPLKKLSIKVDDFTFMSAVAIKFLPILFEEANKIKEAQMARGVCFEGANIFKKGKNLVYILVPIFISTLQKSNDLAMAMEARCFRGAENRNSLRVLKYVKNDKIVFAIMIAFTLSIICERLI